MNGPVKQAWIGALAAVILGAGQVQAQHSPVVVELYTSQGCSSCPPADALLADLSRHPGVIALALHVDYWDYLGWTDSFAKPGFTKRQKRYARAHGQKMIYTPQMIIGGIESVQGNLRQDVMARIDGQTGKRARVHLSATRQGDRLMIEATAVPPLDRAAVVQVIRYSPYSEVRIERGENAGRHAAYHNIVSDWAAVADWAGLAPLQMEAVAEGDGPVVVIVQEAGPGAVLAAIRLD